MGGSPVRHVSHVNAAGDDRRGWYRGVTATGLRGGRGGRPAAPVGAIAALGGYAVALGDAWRLSSLHLGHGTGRADGFCVRHRLGVNLLGDGHEPAVEQNDHPVLPPGALDRVEAHEKVFR